ncbi:hypothetical protein BV22DRAFT_585451 [Leucogyrophana mollusca]|uniref:Uncharacterized protein n=1 Tax=Leucogyrophana mollusca TaxID=85980 RepID=A0ACB8BDT6_9AGAM|nr:hypothetical protein BV22DRAFT_585451 [Leucogyrophana mollusca]
MRKQLHDGPSVCREHRSLPGYISQLVSSAVNFDRPLTCWRVGSRSIPSSIPLPGTAGWIHGWMVNRFTTLSWTSLSNCLTRADIEEIQPPVICPVSCTRLAVYQYYKEVRIVCNRLEFDDDRVNAHHFGAVLGSEDRMCLLHRQERPARYAPLTRQQIESELGSDPASLLALPC